MDQPQVVPLWRPRRSPISRLGAALSAFFRHNLRARVALGLGLPIFLTLSLLSLAHYWRERHLLADQAQLTATQISQVVLGGLRQSMLANHPTLMDSVLADSTARETIERAQIMDLDGTVLVDTGPARQSTPKASAPQTSGATDANLFGVNSCFKLTDTDCARQNLVVNART